MPVILYGDRERFGEPLIASFVVSIIVWIFCQKVSLVLIEAATLRQITHLSANVLRFGFVKTFVDWRRCAVHQIFSGGLIYAYAFHIL